MRSTNAATTISALSNLFTRYGFPEQVVSDNGPPFQSREYAEFLKQNGIQRVLVSPYQEICSDFQEIPEILSLIGYPEPEHPKLPTYLL